MKQNRLNRLILITTLFSIILTGCGSPRDTKPEDSGAIVGTEAVEEAETEQMIPAVDEVLIDHVYAETEPNEPLADFLTDYYEIPEEYQSETRYYYDYIDLNEDGVQELFALIVGEYTTESCGDALLLLEPCQDGFKVLEAFTCVRTPILISENRTNGWNDIVFPTYGAGTDTGYLICHYNEKSYQTEANEFLEELPEDVSGTKILCNNLIDDMDKGTYFTLAPDSEENSQKE